MDIFYVYAHITEDTGKCFYIGKGCFYRSNTKSQRSKEWNNIVKKHGFKPIILVNNISEKKALELEDSFINQIGIENLVNIRAGFAGGYRWSKPKKDKGKSKPKNFKGSKKSIIQYNLEGNFIKKYKSLKEASKILNINPRAISNNLLEYNKTSGGYIWKYNK